MYGAEGFLLVTKGKRVTVEVSVPRGSKGSEDPGGRALALGTQPP